MPVGDGLEDVWARIGPRLVLTFGGAEYCLPWRWAITDEEAGVAGEGEPDLSAQGEGRTMAVARSQPAGPEVSRPS